MTGYLVIVVERDWQRWLDALAEAVADLIHPDAGNDLQAWPVDGHLMSNDVGEPADRCVDTESVVPPQPPGTAHETLMALLISLFAASAMAQTSPACRSQSRQQGWPSRSPALRRTHPSYQAEITAACEAKAVSESGKKLAGAAKNSFMKKCEAEAIQRRHRPRGRGYPYQSTGGCRATARWRNRPSVQLRAVLIERARCDARC